MTALMWVVLSLIIILVLIMLLSFKLKKGKRLRPDYYSLFIMGTIWLPAGILMKIFGSGSGIGEIFIIIGAIYFVVGLMHKEDWKTNHRNWEQLNKKEKKWKLIILIILGLIILVGILLFLFVLKGIL